MYKKLLFSILFIITISGFYSCGQGNKELTPVDSKLKLANAYYTNGLYEASAQEYQDYLNHYEIEPSRRANTYYTIANIYFERLQDYDKALEFYFKIKYLYPESSLQGDVGKRIVNCLERLQRSGDAARILEKEAALDQSSVKEKRPGAVIAETGNRKITQGDLDFEISKLPVYIQEQFKDKKRKAEFLQQYILQELLYESAKRKGLDKNKEVVEGTFRAQKSLMAEKILQEELQDQVKIEAADVELYYMAHKDKYVEKDNKGKVKRQKSFNEVAQQAAQDLAQDRQQQAYQKLIDRLMKTENVKIYESRIQ